jgi:uncharacterized protein YkwD
MLKRFSGIIFIVLILSVHAVTADATSWKKAFYRKFSYGDFRSFAPANRKIEFGDIDYPLLNAALFFATNSERARHGLKPFRHSGALEKAAFDHSKDMAEHGFFSHESPYKGQRRSPFERMASCGVNRGYRAENIATGFGIRYQSGSPVFPPHHYRGPFRDPGTGRTIPCHTYNSLAEAIVASWMRSEDHRDNILNRRLKYLGSGAFHFRDRSFYGIDMFDATQDFASYAPD